MDYMIILRLLSEDKDNKKFYIIKNINCFFYGNLLLKTFYVWGSSLESFVFSILV